MLLLAVLLVVAGCERATEESDSETVPALITAAESGDLDAITMLLDTESPVDIRDSCHWTPLMKAALNGHTGIIKTLLDAGARVDLADKGGYTALMLAASNNHVETMRLLIDRGADPNHVEMTNGWTALIWAAKRGHLGSVDLLLQRGALSSTRGFDGRSAADWAEEGGFSGVVHLLGQE